MPDIFSHDREGNLIKISTLNIWAIWRPVQPVKGLESASKGRNDGLKLWKGGRIFIFRDPLKANLHSFTVGQLKFCFLQNISDRLIFNLV